MKLSLLALGRNPVGRLALPTNEETIDGAAMEGAEVELFPQQRKRNPLVLLGVPLPLLEHQRAASSHLLPECEHFMNITAHFFVAFCLCAAGAITTAGVLCGGLVAFKQASSPRHVVNWQQNKTT